MIGMFCGFRDTGGLAMVIRRCAPQEEWMKRILPLTLLFLGAALLFSIGISIDSSRAADDSKINIIYSSNLLGYLEPCG